MKTVALSVLGRAGNQLFRYAFARALCEQNGYELRTEPWFGEQCFTLDGHEPKRPDGTEDIVIDGYCQNQESLIYSRADCRRWFAFKPVVEELLRPYAKYVPHAHFRRGDYQSLDSYPLISRKSVDRAADQYLPEHTDYIAVSDASPLLHGLLTGDLAMLPDFYRMMKAPVLFRANSSFSYWAGVLGHGKVFSPIITGFTGGKEHDNVPYVEGNWPALAQLPNITDLYLRET